MCVQEMYSECTSLTEVVQSDLPSENVLHNFPTAVGKEIVQAVMRPLLGSSVELKTAEQVKWTMQVRKSSACCVRSLGMYVVCMRLC